MVRLAGRVHSDKLTVRRTEELVREYLAGTQEQRPNKPERTTPKEFDDASRTIQEALTLPVRVKPSRGGGKIEIRFRERQQLEAIVALLTSKGSD